MPETMIRQSTGTGPDPSSIIYTRNLTKCYGERTVVHQLNLDIARGEIFGLLGPNGAGKTTTILMLLGMTEITDGEAYIDGMDCERNPIGIKTIVGYLPDQMGFYPDMTGRENLRFTGRLNGLSGRNLEERIEGLLERVGMTEAADKKAGTYSRGMKQRLGIADVLMKDPRVVIMDEPTLGIDPEGIRELTGLIRRLAKEDGRTILISSHQLYQIQQVCDRVGLFVDGSMIACGKIDELAAQVADEGTYLLETAAFPDDAGFESLLNGLGNVKEVKRQGETYLVASSSDIKRELLRKTLDNHYTLTHLKEKGGDLDEIYHRYFEKAGFGGTDDENGTRGRKRFAIFKAQ